MNLDRATRLDSLGRTELKDFEALLKGVDGAMYVFLPRLL